MSNQINVRDFIVANYTPYDCNGNFFAGPTQRTKKLWDTLSQRWSRSANPIYKGLHPKRPGNQMMKTNSTLTPPIK